MARLTSGWVKTHRVLFETFKNEPPACFLYIYLTSMANWVEGENKIYLDGKAINLKRGQLVAGAIEISRKLKMSRNAVKRALDLLEKESFIVTVKGREGMVITIEDYDHNQADERKPERSRYTGGSGKGSIEVHEQITPRVDGGPPIKELRIKKENEEKEDIIDFDIRSSAPISGSKKSFLISYWNSKEGLPIWVSTRRDQEILDLEETKEEGYWKRLVDDVARTDYLCARNGSTFRATLVWAVRNHADIASGKYAKHGISMIKKDTRDWAKIEANFKKQLYGEK